MRFHVQNPVDDPDFAITPAQVAEAAAAAGAQVRATFGTTVEEFAAVATDVEVLIGCPAELRPLLPELARRAPRLEMVFANVAGVDGLAPFDWLPRGVALLNNSGTHATKAGEYVAMACLALAARLPAMAAAQAAGQWRKIHTPPLAARRVTIVGVGDLGSAGARALRGLGVAATGVRASAEPHPDFAETVSVAAFDRVLPRTDIVVLACPLTPATDNLLDRRRLALLPPGAGVVNIGRGRLLDQAALCEALAAGHLSGAMLDVMEPEPLPEGHALWRTPNLLLTPHVSCDDPDSYNAVSLGILFANLRARREGRAMPNRVDPARGY